MPEAAMTPQEWQVQEKALLKKVKSEAKNAITDEFVELLEKQGLTKGLIQVMKSIDEAKTPAHIIKLKGKVKSLEEKAAELTAKMEQAVADGGHKGDNSLLGAFMKGTNQLWERGMFEKLALGDLGTKNAFINVRVDFGMKYGRKGKGGNLAKKVDTPMNETTSVVPIGSGIAFSLTQFEPGLTRVTRRAPFLVELVNTARTLSSYIAWVEQTNIAPGVAGSTSEGALATAGSFRWTENDTKAQKITYDMKVTNEMLADLAQIEMEIKTEILDLIALKLDSMILTGNGVAPALKGISQYAPGFVNLLTQGVTAPNNVDCLIAAILQIKANGTSPGAGAELTNIFVPNTICLNPADAAMMALTKDTLNRYVMNAFPYLQENGENIKMLEACRIIENIGVPSGSYLVMDSSKSNVRIREDATIAYGYENTDFTDGLVTIKGEMRAAHYIKTNHVNAFVYDTFANTKSIIGSI